MLFSYAYRGQSEARNDGEQTHMRFAPDASREPTFFRGELAASLVFREAISALHEIVVSDLRWKPKDRTAYLAWRAQQDDLEFGNLGVKKRAVAERMDTIATELEELRRRSRGRMKEFRRAEAEYFRHLYRINRDAWFVLDPVITVHPDELFFECFSQDESTYGRLGTSYEVYRDIGEFACGTTNIDYSQGLFDEFQKIRTYKSTKLEVDPEGFQVQTTNEPAFREVKIDLPDSWVRGFLQVSSAMSLPAVTFDLQPMDLHNLCFVLRRHRERVGPRSMRFHLEPGRPVRVVFEPWNIEVVCGRSIYAGPDAAEIRVWGRRRIHVLERLIPIAKTFTVHLLGTGLPAFYVADLGAMSFTLGLSGWTANDWARAGNFDLMAPRAAVDAATVAKVFAGLKETWFDTPDHLGTRLGLDRATVLGALSILAQAGRAIYDLNKRVYRARELSREPLPMEALRFANLKEALATRLRDAGQVSTQALLQDDGATRIEGTVQNGADSCQVAVTLDADERIAEATCSCIEFRIHKLYKGPCAHILAARMNHASQPALTGNLF